MLSDSDLKAIIEGEIQSTVDWLGGKISDDREKALDYYYGEPFGNEIDGRSQFVSTDVQDVIESVMPDFMEMFASGETVVEFMPIGPEDEEEAKQQTAYVNYIWNVDNKGFEVTYDWIKDALLMKVGIIKIYYDKTPEEKIETLSKVNIHALQVLMNDDTIEILEQDEAEKETQEDEMASGGYPLFDVKIKKTFNQGKVVIIGVPSDEFYISRQEADLDDAEFKMHKTQKTVSEMIEMGFDRDLVESLPSHDEESFNEERQNRFQQEEWLDNESSHNSQNRKIWLYDIYMKVDYDEDGVSELRNILYAGSEILSNEEVDDHPFVSLCPIRMPHVFHGRSLAELMFDIQYLKSTVFRQIMDNMYLVNNARSAVSQKVSLEDYLTNRPGGVIRVDTMGGDVAAHIAPLRTDSIIHHALPVVEMLDGIREIRTGQTRYNQGMDADSLNKTATGINMILNEAQKRKLLMARLFAETGFKRAFKKILRLVVNNQDYTRTIRLNNKFVQVDPRSWVSDKNLSIKVGLGFGTKESRLAALQQIINNSALIVQAQGGLNGPLITFDHVYKMHKQFIELGGFKPSEMFVDSPEGKQPPPPQPNPDIEKAKIDAQVKNQEMQMDDQRKRQEIKLEHDRGLIKLDIEARQAGVQIDMAKAKQNAELAMKEFEKFGQDGPQSSQMMEMMAQMMQAMAQNAETMTKLAQVMAAPKEVVRDSSGRVVGMRVG